MAGWQTFFQNHQTAFIRRIERPVLQVVSLGFSFASAHAIQWFLSPLNSTDPTQFIITLIISGGLGVLGYFVTRGLADRLMNGESIWGYLPLVLVVEFAEIFTNFAKAQVAVQQTTWVNHALPALVTVNILCTYILYSIVPLVGPFLAVVDMDLERKRKQPYAQPGKTTAVAGRAQPVPPRAQAVPARPQGQSGVAGGATPNFSPQGARPQSIRSQAQPQPAGVP